MARYIELNAVVEEIEKIEKALKNACKPNPFGNVQECMTAAELQALDVVKETINTLEVKEVDLDALGVLAEHLIACDAHLVTPKYTDKEHNLLEEWAKNNKTQKAEKC